MLDETAVSYQVVLTKVDKINPFELETVKKATEQALAKHPAAFPVVLATSSETQQGLPELRATIAALIRG